jgi:hypothetical protein
VSGCAGCRNTIAAKGGLIGSYEGNYVVINYTGGVIADVWVLRDVYVQSEENSDGWRFTDPDGNVIFLGGDIKVIRIKEADDLKKWHEYHMEFEDKIYQDTIVVEDKVAGDFGTYR